MDSKKLAVLCAQKCLDKKAENVVILDLENRSSVADYFVVCSGFSDRQVRAVADFVSSELHALGVKAISEEGMGDGKWSLIDFGDVIVHVFQDHLRDHFSLESLWLDAPKIRLRDTSGEQQQSDYGSAYSGSLNA